MIARPASRHRVSLRAVFAVVATLCATASGCGTEAINPGDPDDEEPPKARDSRSPVSAPPAGATGGAKSSGSPTGSAQPDGAGAPVSEPSKVTAECSLVVAVPPGEDDGPARLVLLAAEGSTGTSVEFAYPDGSVSASGEGPTGVAGRYLVRVRDAAGVVCESSVALPLSGGALVGTVRITVTPPAK